MPGYVANYDGSAVAIIMGGTSFSFPTAPATQGDVLAYHVASAALLPTSRAWGIATTSTAGITLANTTAATVGTTVQRPPALQMDGTAWSSGAGASTTERWRIENLPATAATATSSLTFSRAQDAGAFSAVASFTSGAVFNCGSVLASGSYTSAATVVMEAAVNRSWGLGTATSFFKYAGDTPLVLASSIRGDAASNIVHAFVYDRNAALITNAGTMFNALASWTNNSDAISHMVNGYYDGALWLAGGNSYSDDGSTATGGVHYGAGLNIKNLSAVLTIAAAATTTSTVTIPAGAVVLGVSCRVTTVIPTAATFTLGHAGSAALWGTGISTAANAVNTGAAVPALFATATAIVVTPNTAPANNTGRLRICIHYYLPTAPTS